MLDNKIHNWIIKRIIELLIKQNRTLSELAHECYLSPSTIQNYISGKTTMKLENIITVGVALSGSLNKFFDNMDASLYREISDEIQNLK